MTSIYQKGILKKRRKSFNNPNVKIFILNFIDVVLDKGNIQRLRLKYGHNMDSCINLNVSLFYRSPRYYYVLKGSFENYFCLSYEFY